MKRVAILVLALSVLAAPALAQDAEARANALSKEIASPFCPGVTLHECPSAEALRLRDRIEAWFAAGLSREAILDRLEAEYGAGIRAAPETEGAGLLAWLLPALAAVGALVLASVLTRRWSRAAEVPPAPGMVEADLARVEEELALMRRGTQP